MAGLCAGAFPAFAGGRKTAGRIPDGNCLANNKPDWERLPAYGYRGLIEIPLFGMLGLDAISPGNREFDYGFYWNYRLFNRARFDALAANVTVTPGPAVKPLIEALKKECDVLVVLSLAKFR